MRYTSRRRVVESMEKMTFWVVHVICAYAEDVPDNVNSLIRERVPNMAYFIEEFSSDY